MDTRKTVEAFVRAVNSGDTDLISACMDEDHVFIDSLGRQVAGLRSPVMRPFRGCLGLVG